jgi:chromosome segregation ATPase
MTREDIRKMLATLQKQEEALADRKVEVDNYQALLEDSKTAQRVAEDEANRLQQQLDATAELIAEKEAQLQRMDSYYTGRQAGLANLEKDLADKDKEIARLNDERNALQNRKPEVLIKEVETTPAGYKSISESLEKRNAELKQLEEQLVERRAELERLEADRKKEAGAIEAANRVQAAMQEALSAFEQFAGKLTLAQVAVQASDGLGQHEPLVQTLAAMMRKHLSEIETGLRKL